MDLRTRLFDLYAANLDEVKKHPNVRVEPDIPGLFLCPICFRGFNREALFLEPRPVTLEHVPPEALGGKPRTLTCAVCNNEAGHELDSHLLHHLDLLDFVEAVPGSSVDAEVTVDQLATIHGTLTYTSDDVLSIVGDPDRSDPNAIEKLKSHPPEQINVRFSGLRGRHVRVRRPEAALIRIAYLWAFSVFGYGFLINGILPAVRTQFRNPSEEILPAWGVSRDPSLPDESLGISILTKPEALQSFVVCFDLESSNRIHRYAVMLPGPTSPGGEIYNNLAASEGSKSLDISMQKIKETEEYLSNPELKFASHEMWKHWR